MHYCSMFSGRFLSRPNRFIAHIEIDGNAEICHVKNTGRCRELLIPGATVWCQRCFNPARKTKFDLIAVQKGARLINMDSTLPNAVAAEWLPVSGLFSPSAKIRREVTFGGSRFDLYVEDGERRAFMEVKGVTLEREGVAMFPDAPTERGVKHLRELCEAVKQGYEGYLLFVVQMKGIREVRPNDETHALFGKALREAVDAGVKVLAVDCLVWPNEVRIDRPLLVIL